MVEEPEEGAEPEEGDEPEEDEGDEEAVAGPAHRRQATWFGSGLEEWAEAQGVEQESVRVAAYRLGENGKKVFCYEWRNAIPSPHEMGMELGGGSYYLMLNSKRPNGKTAMTSRLVNIDPEYTYRREQAKREAAAGAGSRALVPMGLPAPAAGGSMVETLALVKAIAEILKPPETVAKQMNEFAERMVEQYTARAMAAARQVAQVQAAGPVVSEAPGESVSGMLIKMFVEQAGPLVGQLLQSPAVGQLLQGLTRVFTDPGVGPGKGGLNGQSINRPAASVAG